MQVAKSIQTEQQTVPVDIKFLVYYSNEARLKETGARKTKQALESRDRLSPCGRVHIVSLKYHLLD